MYKAGHIAAARIDSGLPAGPHLALHLSGGTTEVLACGEDGSISLLGGSADLHAGQFVDRVGVRLGLPFPAGKALDALYNDADTAVEFRVKLSGLTFSLSGMENQVKKLLEKGEKPANIARFTLDTVISVVFRATQEAQRRYPGLPVLCSGGVASNARLREVLKERCGALFAQPRYAADNAMGTAILTWRALERGERP